MKAELGIGLTGTRHAGEPYRFPTLGGFVPNNSVTLTHSFPCQFHNIIYKMFWDILHTRLCSPHRPIAILQTPISHRASLLFVEFSRPAFSHISPSSILLPWYYRSRLKHNTHLAYYFVLQVLFPANLDRIVSLLRGMNHSPLDTP